MSGTAKFVLVLLVLVLCVVGFGFYSGWFTLSKSGPDAGSNKVDINLTVDPDKMKQDADAVKDKTTELAGKAKEEAKELGDSEKDSK